LEAIGEVGETLVPGEVAEEGLDANGFGVAREFVPVYI
jgi:hypothetical protein